MSHSFDWRCDACEKPNQHDFTTGSPGASGAAAPGDGLAGAELQGSNRTLSCSSCRHQQRIAAPGFDDAGVLLDPIEVCLACSSNRLYTQKDFNRKLGVAVVIVGAAFSPWTYGLSLVACMALDYGLYYFVPEITVCYACDAIHRGFAHNPSHRAHDPLLAERFRREARQELGLDEPETEVESDDR